MLSLPLYLHLLNEGCATTQFSSQEKKNSFQGTVVPVEQLFTRPKKKKKKKTLRVKPVVMSISNGRLSRSKPK